MGKLLIFIGMSVFGWLGWWLGSKIGPGTAYIISGAGTLLGVYIGWRINRDYLY